MDSDANVRHLLELELTVLEKGGWGRSVRDPLKPEPVFQHSVSCINHWLVPGHSTESCEGCVLLGFVPEGKQRCAVPCHEIPLDESGVTVADLLDRGDETELKEKVRNWLHRVIGWPRSGRPVSREAGSEAY